MLQLIGENGKSVIIDAIQKLYGARVYVYDKEEVNNLDAYFVSQKCFSIEEFCESVKSDLEGYNVEQRPINTVVLYTNSLDINIISELWYLAKELEEKHYAVRTMVASRQ